MIKRCRYPHLFPRYVGITVCEQWLVFQNFLEDMGERPSLDHSIDRIDNSKGYNKENCRWANCTEQSLNRRPYGTLLTGVRLKGAKFSAEITINRKRYHLGTFKTEREAHEKFIQERCKRIDLSAQAN